jgi:hypothetical protein
LRITPRDALSELSEFGFTQSQIVTQVAKLGAATTQETISRIGTGIISSPRYDLGSAIVLLLDRVKKEAAAV